MQIVIDLDSFWVGFVAGVLAFFLLGLMIGARMKNKQAKLEARVAVAKATNLQTRKR